MCQFHGRAVKIGASYFKSKDLVRVQERREINASVTRKLLLQIGQLSKRTFLLLLVLSFTYRIRGSPPFPLLRKRPINLG